MGPDELLLFGGAMLAHATRGALRALEHRVGVPDADERFTAPYFFRASLGARLPGRAAGDAAAAGPTVELTARDFIRSTRAARVAGLKEGLKEASLER